MKNKELKELVEENGLGFEDFKETIAHLLALSIYLYKQKKKDEDKTSVLP